MKKFILFCFSAFLLSASYAQPVTLDPTFGQNGMTVISTKGEVKLVDFDNYGNIIAVGTTNNGNKDYLTIVKTNADGIIDQSFGDNGIVNGPECSPTAQFGLKITNENKIFITGSFYANQYDDFRRTFMQFNENGSLDESFGENGKIVLNFGAFVSTINLESDDFLLFGGADQSSSVPLILKCSYSGELDHNFGENGKLYLTDSETYRIRPKCIKILSDQSILIAGCDDLDPWEHELASCKLTSNGNFVTTFANNGIWKMNVFDDITIIWHDYESFVNVIEDSNGNLIFLGAVYSY